MTEKLLTIEELIKEFEKLPKNTVVSVEYNEWLYNHPIGKFKFVLSFEDAKILFGGMTNKRYVFGIHGGSND